MQSYDCKSKSYFQTASNVSFTKVPFISFLPDISALISSWWIFDLLKWVTEQQKLMFSNERKQTNKLLMLKYF